MGGNSSLSTLFVIVVIAALTPILLGLLPRVRIPSVVVLLAAGVLVGPYVLDVAEPDSVELLSRIGLGFLFLLAGYEIEFEWFVRRSGRLAMMSWFISLAIALAVTGALTATGYVAAFVPVALALTTTALGVLVPILAEAGMLGGSFRELVLASGAVGELFPIIAIAVFLTTGGTFAGVASLLVMGVVALAVSGLQRATEGTRLEAVVSRAGGGTSQATLRLTVVLLVGLLVLAERFGLDIVLGAFLAGMVLRRWSAGDSAVLDSRLESVGYGFFIPIFFVTSGMAIDIDSIAEAPLRLALYFALLLLVRGLPTLIVYRRALRRPEAVELMFLNATALPLIVALVAIGLATGTMLPENAAALVGAGALSVLVFPAVAARLHARDAGAIPRSSGPATSRTGSGEG